MDTNGNLKFPLILAFFEGQVPENKEFNDLIFYLVYYANFSYESVWSMPVFQKRYFLTKLIEEKEREAKQIESAK